MARSEAVVGRHKKFKGPAAMMASSQARVARVESGAVVPSSGWLLRAALALEVDPALFGVTVMPSGHKACREGISPTPRGTPVTLTIDREGGRDDPCRL